MSILALPRRRRRNAAHPYPELPSASLSVTEAIEALAPVEEAERPAPTFTPAALRETRAQPAYAEAQQAFTAPPAFTTDPGALRAAVTALRGEARGEHPYPELPSAPRVAFTDDLRDLPLFRQTARQVGWCGLHYPARRYGWPFWTTDGWAAKVSRELDRMVALARADLVTSAAEFAEVESRRAAAADAAIFPVRHQ